MMDDFQLLYGNDEKIEAGMDAATAVFGGNIEKIINLGDWDASTNNPVLIDSVGTNGEYYTVTVAGSQDLGSGVVTYTTDDVVKHTGSVWEAGAIPI